MPVNVQDVTLISVSASATDFLNRGFPTQNRNTVRIVEIIGGLLTVQLSGKGQRAQIRTAVAGGVVSGALVGFLQEVLRVRNTSSQVVSVSNEPQNLQTFQEMPSQEIFDLSERFVIENNFQDSEFTI